jgi:hypothetical protein
MGLPVAPQAKFANICGGFDSSPEYQIKSGMNHLTYRASG